MSALDVVTTVRSVTDEERNYKARRTAIGMSVSALAKAAGVDRGSLTALEAGHEVRDTTVAAVEKALRSLEHEMGMDVPTQVAPVDAPEPFVRIKVENVYGARALIVEGSVADLAELEAAVDRILRRLAQPGE